MSTYFTYSILQYKHNLVLGEVLNVGILFYFQNENKFEFVKGDGYRAKSIYPDFDNSIFNSYLKSIIEKIKTHVDLYNQHSDKLDFAKYIHQYILAEDAAGLVFKEPVQIKNIFSDNKKTVDEYSKLLLPGIILEKPAIVKHNEHFILKTFTGYIQSKHKSIENKFRKNEILVTDHFKIKFELAWKNDTDNYIKPLSFDLTEENSIQNKAAIIYSHLIELTSYAKKNNLRFDLLIAQPTNNNFRKDYENALDLIDSVKINKQLIAENQWQKYTQETINVLELN